LHDLVSCERKHNEANGEDNRDGVDQNYSRNWGAEGPSDSQRVRRMRERIKRNFLATLLLSQGVPMIVAGDEMGRTQRGNNNAYCQDNEISWIDWDLGARDHRLLAFTRRLIEVFHANPAFRRRGYFTGRPLGDGLKDLAWIRPDGREMTDEDWSDQSNQVLGMLVDGRATDDVDERGRPVFGDTLLVLLNGGGRSRFFVLPEVEGSGAWEEIVNTARPETTRFIRGEGLMLVAHSLILLRFGNASTAPSR
jgi:glycogen operon protein